MYVAKNTFEIMRPFVVVTRIFGLCPVTYEQKGAYFIMKRSIKYILYSYILAIVLVSTVLMGVINDLKVDEKESVRMKSMKTRYITCCDISVVIMLVVFGIVSTPFKQKTFWKMLKCFNNLDNWLPITTQEVQKYKRTSRNFILVLMIGFSVIVAFDVSVWDRLSRINNNSDKFWKNYTTFYMLYYIVLMQEIFFCHVVYFSKIRLTHLNKALASEARIRDSVNSSGSRTTVATLDLAKELNTTYLGKGGHSTHKLVDMSNYDKMATFGQVYERIVEVVEYVNEVGGLGIIIILLSCLLHLIVTPYFLLYEIANNGNKVFICLQTVWLITHSTRLLLVVEPCHQFLIENSKTINLVLQLLAFVRDEEARKTLHLLALQVSQCKIRFYSCGLVKIDRSLITAVVGAVTTYLVILFQFNKV
ncbi:gustatory receptor for sugar taste 43a-like [Aethina tumida]|uniref:gustatory receptor for sugar taste 43a-like n=1 Tax=Aethina tumida TaxID=116153 RepID=UPI002147FDA6|nr:gustatory receptor for sugar taste 43a-like [Aethina tumida]